MDKNVIIRLETPEDYRTTENVVREAFWNVYRPGCSEHYVLHCLRQDRAFIPSLDLVMEIDGQIIGQIMYVRAEITLKDGYILPVATFGPIGILPQYQRQGYGKLLLEHSMAHAKALGIPALCMEGDIRFYGTCGFVTASTKGIHYHGEPQAAVVPYFLCKELQEGYLEGHEGTYHTPAGYFVQDEAVEQFDKDFPHKEKLVLPGQIFQ